MGRHFSGWRSVSTLNATPPIAAKSAVSTSSADAAARAASAFESLVAVITPAMTALSGRTVRLASPRTDTNTPAASLM